MDIKFLGTGTSHGVPVAGCSCGTCTSLDPKNRRYRTSLMIRDKGSAIIIDTPAEFRLRTLEYKIERIDALLITHAHSDHIAGLDDIRRYNELQASSIPAYCDAEQPLKSEKDSAIFLKIRRRAGANPKLTWLKPRLIQNFT